MKVQEQVQGYRLGYLTSLVMLLFAMISIQLGASIAKQLFPVLGPSAMTALRTSMAALLLGLLWRPWRIKLHRRAWIFISLYGSSLGCMNLLFYLALERIPLGLAVAIEFTGPLALSLFGSRRWFDLFWVSLAAGGIILIFPQALSGSLDLVGVGFALGAACCWALYIVWGKKLGSEGHSGYNTAWGMLMAALFVAPFGFPSLLMKDMNLETAALALFVAIFSSALPYSLEMVALKNIPTRTFGILMSFEPVVALIIGRFMLGDRLSPSQSVAVACVVFASLGSILTSRRL